MKSTADKLVLAQAPVAEEDLIIFILNVLGSKFQEISTAVRARESVISFEELHDKLTDYEITIKKISIIFLFLLQKQIMLEEEKVITLIRGNLEVITIMMQIEAILLIKRKDLFQISLLHPPNSLSTM